MVLPKDRGGLPRAARGRWLVAILLALGAPMPGVVRAQDWYDLYADGQRALANGQPARAADLFRQAIRRRPAPGRSVPTYGTNFEPRYYPYLRLADALIRLEEWDDALETLATSARFGIEPAAERAPLEAKARAGLNAIGPAPSPVPAPAPSPPPPPPPPVVAESTGRTTPPLSREPVSAPPDTARSSATAVPRPPPVESPRKTGPVLELTSDPPGAQVFIDDALVGRTDPETGRLRLTTLAPGRHRVRFSADGRLDLVAEVALGSETVPFRAMLARTAPPLERATDRSVPPVSSTAPVSRWWPLAALLLVGVASWSVWTRRSGKPGRGPARGHGTPEAARSGSFEQFPIDFGDYRLTRRIGKGGMAVVYHAERRGDQFALKRPLNDYLDDPRFIERFVREADLGRALHHPNIIRIIDRGQVGDTPYFAMELIEGETLRERLDRDGPLDPILATAITARVAEALDYAHLKGVIHRDLKPGNIMLDRGGGVKVMDYGIARAQHREGVTTTGAFVGTPHYAAPEAVESHSEPRSDLYSLGVVFFEMLTGTLPFSGDNPLAVLRAHAFNPPPVPSAVRAGIPAPLDRIVLRLLAKEPAERPTAEALLNELADFLEAHR